MRKPIDAALHAAETSLLLVNNLLAQRRHVSHETSMNMLDDFQRARALAEIAVTAYEDKIKEQREALKSCLGYIEMTLAHRGVMDVAQIMEELKRVQGIAQTETSHHLGCSQTTRSVDLTHVRDLISEAA